MKNVIELIKARREAAKNDGFSLLELVVAVGILLVLTVGGLLAYNGITDNARQAAVESAASEIYTAAVAYEATGESTGAEAVTKAVGEWEGSATGDDLTIEGEWVDGAPVVIVTHEAGQTATKPANGTITP